MTNKATGARDSGRIPVTVLTGFLGAGKTSLLNRLVGRADMAGTALFINELGAVGIDHHLVERVDETLTILDSGCLCCTVQGDLMEALMRLHARVARREIPPVVRVLIETTGLADPVPVLRALTEDRQVSARYRCDGVLTVVDAERGRGQLARHREAVAQAAVADRLLLSKTDCAGRAERAALERELAALNPAAPRLDLQGGDIGPAVLFGGGLYADGAAPGALADWLGAERAAAPAEPQPEGVVSGARAASCGPACGHDHGQPHNHAHALDSAGPADGARAGACGLVGPASTGVALAAAPAPAAPTAPGASVAADAARHSGRVRSFVVTFEAAPVWRGLAVVLGEILGAWGPRLLRMKGLVGVPGLAVPTALHGVAGTAYAPVRLAAWPQGGPLADRRGRLVFIGEDLTDDDEAAIRARLAHLPGDREALRRAAACPGLPTRAWLAERVPLTPRGAFLSSAYSIQPRWLREGSVSV